jgi:hypothetical protein
LEMSIWYLVSAAGMVAWLAAWWASTPWLVLIVCITAVPLGPLLALTLLWVGTVSGPGRAGEGYGWLASAAAIGGVVGAAGAVAVIASPVLGILAMGAALAGAGLLAWIAAGKVPEVISAPEL